MTLLHLCVLYKVRRASVAVAIKLLKVIFRLSQFLFKETTFIKLEKKIVYLADLIF